MSHRTLQDIRDYVRVSLDTDSDELPDALLDAWINEGEAHIQHLPWLLSFYEQDYTLNSVASTASYAIDEIGDGTLEEVIGIEADRWALNYHPHSRQVRKYAWSTNEGEPREYSIHAGSIYLWQIPDDVYTYTVRGYRASTITTAAGDEFDIPHEFHVLIGEWALARAYEWQDDEIMSTQKFQRFEQQVDVFSRRYRRTPKGEHDVIGYGTRDSYPNRLPFSWE